MTQSESRPVSDLVDRNAVDADGEKVGKIFDVYLDNDTNEPEWLALNTGMFGSKVSFVPIAGASLWGEDVLIGYDKAKVKGAPTAEADGELSVEEEDALYTYYGRQSTAAPTPAKQPNGDTDDAMTRSEEELDVNVSTRQSGTARIRKWVETEDVHVVVPVRREKARMVTETITDANRDKALDGPEITEGEHVVTLSEEVVDVSKHVEAKERVRLETDVETEDVTVDETVRKERIAMDNEPTKR
jgi:uncharacterized protein (TIGR02271 family)